MKFAIDMFHLITFFLKRLGHSNLVKPNNKKNTFAINAIKFMEIINLSFVMLKLILLSMNAKIVLKTSQHPVVSNITWLYTQELENSIAKNVTKNS